ncbi:Imm21 family immunity protein [Streptomyces sp. NPDC007896]|uniref:Imm21 family immunity protein n=1 Tax=Streptomyces sp. NPDC007896 TaxID=3364784 RepID=UPI0036E2CB62
MVRYADPGAVEWIESGGGPLIVIPEASLSAWRGAGGDDWEDYDRACDVDGHVGLIAVGQSRALVLGFDPVLLDSACPGDGAYEDERLRVEIAAGRYQVQAAQVTPRPRTTFCLVQLVAVA